MQNVMILHYNTPDTEIVNQLTYVQLLTFLDGLNSAHDGLASTMDSIDLCRV